MLGFLSCSQCGRCTKKARQTQAGPGAILVRIFDAGCWHAQHQPEVQKHHVRARVPGPGSTRAAVHLHARGDPSNPVQKCPNITPEETRDIKRLYETKQKKPAKPPPPGGGPGLNGIKKVISGAMKGKVTELFARFAFMCILPVIRDRRADLVQGLHHRRTRHYLHVPHA